MSATIGLGERFKERREHLQLTQLQVANHLGLSRAAVAQWESSTTSPSIEKCKEAARFLHTTPEWLAFGITGEAEVKYLTPADQGFVSVPEVSYGETPTDPEVVGQWGFSTDWLVGHLRVSAPGNLKVVRVEGANMAPQYEYGDKLIVDTGARRPSPGGVFLHWDGVGPALNSITVRPINGTAMAHVSSSADSTDPSYEIEPSKLAIIGRVVGVVKQA